MSMIQSSSDYTALQKALTKTESAVKGTELIADQVQRYYNTVTNELSGVKSSLSEKEATLGARLNSTDLQLNDIANDLVEHKLDYEELLTEVNGKANKAQEAWITPTLINGWAGVSGYPVRYMKDTLGFVHFKGRMTGGTVGLVAFTLPVGYRPINTKQIFPTISNNINLNTLVVNATGTVEIVAGNNVNLHIDSIVFKAEQ